ncbi:hypothetical protein QVD17_07972 [Tagetes erecta]|uniref:CRIB domain-containing protein n=1 Tax=Tagetes erecta TaxID=13708 RepID=A0AAD8KYH2_TARER|nr:hypothetical protein QVD17_07972 [Tagetes erecta]
MKDRMERLIIFPFTAGCVSSSSVSVYVQHGRRPKEHIHLGHTVCRSMKVVKEPKDATHDNVTKDLSKDTTNDNATKDLSKLPALSKPNIYIGFHRLTRTIKSLSQSLVIFKDETEDEETEMEIGLPTDVKHVTHIGPDGPLTNGANGCNHLPFLDDLSLCLGSVAQYEEHANIEPTHVTQGTPNTSLKSSSVEPMSLTQGTPNASAKSPDVEPTSVTKGTPYASPKSPDVEPISVSQGTPTASLKSSGVTKS